jgi:hypothetical protein
LLTRLSQRLCIGAHVGQDDEHVLLALVSEELGSGQRQTGGDDTLDGRVVGQVEEQAHVLHRTVLLEILLEESSGLHVDTHGGKHDGEVVFMVVKDGLLRSFYETSLTTDLSGNLERRMIIIVSPLNTLIDK